jgi:hypothetical protein
MVDYIMWSLIGIFIYLAIGYIFVLWAEAYEDGFWLQVVCMLIWPILAIAFVICIIYFGCNELYKKIKKYEQREL